MGEPQLILLHEERMRRTLAAHAPGSPLARALAIRGLMHILSPYLADLPTEPCTKLRFVYTPMEICTPIWQTYTPRVIRHIHLVDLPPTADYAYKWEDRRTLEVSGLGEDEEALFVRGGLLTDTRFSNIALHIGGEWLTPSTPLLRGVMREHLLRAGRIHPAPLTPADWLSADGYHLINALLPLP